LTSGGTSLWMGSIAMDKVGDLGLGFSESSSTTHPTVAFTGRTPSDPLGTMEGITTIFAGAGSQTGGTANGGSRWGDYSGMAIDPSTDCTFWYVNEYIPSNGNFNWHTRIASFKFPSCGSTVANDFSLSVTPASQTVTAGQSASYTVSTTVTSGSATSVTLSASGLPSGAGASFSPNPVTSGNASTMTVTTSSGTPAGTSTITVTGTSSSTSHSATTSLTVSGGGGAVVTNGGFETGNLSGWTTSGAFLPRVVSTPVHTGSFAAQVGSTSPVNGDSILTQTITVPGGSSTLSFWYNPHCPDTLQFDQEQAQIRSTSGSTLATVLNVCSNSQTWTHVTFDMTPFAGQTVVLWFNDHDDGFSSDPTVTYLDDVTLG
jgi:hypothetical protein